MTLGIDRPEVPEITARTELHPLRHAGEDEELVGCLLGRPEKFDPERDRAAGKARGVLGLELGPVPLDLNQERALAAQFAVGRPDQPDHLRMRSRRRAGERQ
jgi:hypothetical protein